MDIADLYDPANRDAALRELGDDDLLFAVLISAAHAVTRHSQDEEKRDDLFARIFVSAKTHTGASQIAKAIFETARALPLLTAVARLNGFGTNVPSTRAQHLHDVLEADDLVTHVKALPFGDLFLRAALENEIRAVRAWPTKSRSYATLDALVRCGNDPHLLAEATRCGSVETATVAVSRMLEIGATEELDDIAMHPGMRVQDAGLRLAISGASRRVVETLATEPNLSFVARREAMRHLGVETLEALHRSTPYENVRNDTEHVLAELARSSD